MRADLEHRLAGIWYGNEPVPAWLKSLVPVYRLASRIDRWWKLKNKCADLAGTCIVVVGNITVGGSGKTPLVIRLCRIFSEAGLAPGVISRGYGRKERGLRLVSPASSPDVVGDEPLLIARRTGVPVVVAADRCDAARALLKQKVRVIISDDGLQHHRLPRSVEICVIDGPRGLGNGRLIPAGPLRELPERLSSVDHVIINGASDCVPGDIDAQSMLLAPGLLKSLVDGEAWRLSQFAGCTVNAVAGIAHPDRFFNLLLHRGIKVVEYAFADHHAYSAADFSTMDKNFPIMMTEKDAVKCTGLGLKNAWFLTVDAHLPHQWEHLLLQQVIRKVTHSTHSS
ncbi:MAG: tetraacyldisaccharide 4'-kinase [Xanthomonadales bacterium]